MRAPLETAFMRAPLAGASALLALLLLGLPMASIAQDAAPGSVPEPGADETPSPVSVAITSSASEVTVGETFTLDLKVSGPPGTTYTFPAGASDDAIEIRTPPEGADQEDASPPPAPGTHRYEAELFTLGEVELPPIPVRYRLPDGTEGQVETEPVPVEVVSMLPKDPEEQKLADIRDPRTATLGREYVRAWSRASLLIILWILLLAAVIVSWIVWLRRQRPGIEVAPVPEVPPDVEALRALDALESTRLLEGGALRTFYIRLTAIAKRYLERRLGAPVLEMTTAETLSFLRRHEHGGDLLPVIRDLAEAADRIKFARGQGVVAEAERHLGSVRAMVPALEARLAPPAPAETGEAA